jgi:hypothetical protein
MLRCKAFFALLFSLLLLFNLPAAAADQGMVVVAVDAANEPTGDDHAEDGGAGSSAANGGTPNNAPQVPADNAPSGDQAAEHADDDEEEGPSCGERLAAALRAFPDTPFAQFLVRANMDLYDAQSAPFVLSYLHTLSVIYRGYIGPILENPDVVLPFCIIHFIYDIFSYIMQTGPLQQCSTYLCGENTARRLPYILFTISTAVKIGLQPDPHFAALSLFLISRTMPWSLPESTVCYRLCRNFVNWLFFYICYEFAPTPYGVNQ